MLIIVGYPDCSLRILPLNSEVRTSLAPKRSSVRFLICFPLLTAAWVPFFDDMNAIIFLAPISCFDQVLAEDPNVNRLVSAPSALRPPVTQ